MSADDVALDQGNDKKLAPVEQLSGTILSPHDQRNDENSSSKRRARAYVWTYFEKIMGEDGLPKTRCTTCNKVYATAPNSGTSTMRRHLRKCCPKPLTQYKPNQPIPYANTARSSDEMSEEVRAAKKLKFVMMDNLQSKTDRELVEFIWMNKRNVGILEQKLPEKARAIKEAIKCYEDEIDRRAILQSPKENDLGPDVSTRPDKVEADGQLVAQYKNVRETLAGVNQKTSPQVDSGKLVIKQEVGSQYVHGNENFHENIGEEEHAGRLQIVAMNQDKNQKTCPQVESGKLVIKQEVGSQYVLGNEHFHENIGEEEHAGRLQIVAMNQDEDQVEETPVRHTISILPHDTCADLREVSSVLSMLTSPNGLYTPQGTPLDQEAENAKQTLIQLLEKDFESIVKSSDEQKVKSCIQILIENLHKLPMCQGRVIETLNTDFETTCQNWKMCHTNIQTNIALQVKQGDKLKGLKEWQKNDMEFEYKISKVDADILRLQAELHEKERTRENLVKQKSKLFDDSKISIEEAKKLLQDMVTSKLQSDVAMYSMKEAVKKWERNRENFQMK
ncbi:hypothetical protein R6Q57_016126 [Mikania cordata]